MALVLTLKAGERLRLRDTRSGEETWVTVVRSNNSTARLAIDAPPLVEILREELLARDGATPHDAEAATDGP
jgi:sRNA-binding carbon storage regulator CsrA